MPRITSIKPQKNGIRVNIYLDGKFGFGLDLTNFVKLGLKVEQQLSEGEVTEIRKKGSLSNYLENILRFATLRPRSKKEITDWLRRKKVAKTYQKSLLEKLETYELLNDEKFAIWWVEQRMQFRSKSKLELENELRLKGIDREIVKNVIADASIDEPKQIRKLLLKNIYKWQRFDKRTRRTKMHSFLLRKGFAWESIKKVVDDFID